MNPPDLKYSKEHEWVRMDGDTAIVGITRFAADSLGDVVYVDLPEEGSSISQFQKMGEIESVKAVSDLFSPVGGEITERNATLVEKPETVNESPYENGWLLKVTLSDSAQLDKLLTAEQYDEFLSEGNN